MSGLARARFATLLQDPAFEGLIWPNIERSLDFVLDFELGARDEIERVFVERRGEIAIPLAGGEPFRLRARADRIDVLRSGGASLIDYKSGAPPGAKEVKVGFAPQLTLEAAMLTRGGFEGLERLTPTRALYLKLGGPGGGEVKEAGGKSADINDLAETHFAGLKTLLDSVRRDRDPLSLAAIPQIRRPLRRV